MEVVGKIRSRAYIVGIVAVVLFALTSTFIAIFSPSWKPDTLMYGGDASMHAYGALPLMMFGPLMACIVAAATKSFLNKKELVLVISMLMVVLFIPTYEGIFIGYSVFYKARESASWFDLYQRFGEPIYGLWGPDPTKAELWNGFLYGGPVDWSLWGIPTAFFLAWTLPYWLMSVFFAGIIRREWLEVENLPFPTATALTSLVQMTYEKDNGTPKIFKNKWLWLGVVLSIIGTVPAWLYALVPSLQDLRPGVMQVSPGLVAKDARISYVWAFAMFQYAILPWVPIFVNFDLPLIGGCLFVPSTTLLSFIVGQLLLFWIVPPIMVAAGVWDPMPPGKVWNDVYFTYFGTASKWGPISANGWITYFHGVYLWFAVGAMFGLWAVPLLWTYRGELATRLRAIFKPDPEVEEAQPMKYRYMWAGFIGCWILNGIMCYVGSGFGIPVTHTLWSMAAMMCMFALMVMGQARVSAEFGFVGRLHDSSMDSLMGDAFFQQPTYEGVMGSGLFALPQEQRFLANLGTNSLGGMRWVHFAAPIVPMLTMFRVAKDNDVHSKRIFWGSFLAVIVCSVVAAPTLVTLLYTFGAMNVESSGNHAMRMAFYVVKDIPQYKGAVGSPQPTLWIGFIIGVLQTVVVYALRARFPWFPLNAAGMAIGYACWQPWSVFIPAIIAYILKTVVIRIGGQEMHNNKLMPLAIGLISGWTIMTVLSSFSVAFTAIQSISPA